jgi:hypothetical protein
MHGHVWGAWPDSASGCFKKATQTPNAGHRTCLLQTFGIGLIAISTDFKGV